MNRMEEFADAAAKYHTCGGMPQCAACYVDLRSDNAEMRAALTKAAEALEEYGAHLSVDDDNGETEDCWGDPCTCGFDAALAEVQRVREVLNRRKEVA